MVASGFTSLAVLYVVFFVPVGRRTLWQHATRIAGTPEAQELGRDAVGMSRTVVDRARTEIEHGIPAAPAIPPDAVDAGAAPTRAARAPAPGQPLARGAGRGRER
jgi:hypothetical protein